MKIIERLKEALKEALTLLNLFAFLEFLGIAGFLAVLIYCDVQCALGVSLGDVLKNPWSTGMAISFGIFFISFLATNPGQDRLDKAQMDEWRKERKKELIAWQEAHPLVA